jgi:hypothetical protein
VPPVFNEVRAAIRCHPHGTQKLTAGVIDDGAIHVHLTRLTNRQGSRSGLATTRLEMSNAPSHHPLASL